jgi:ribosomal protein S18 acetylase RimI-like enzyme
VVRGADGPVIDLIAVARSQRSHGAGRALVAALAGDGAPIDVGTQGWNTGALRFYERLGFLVRDTRFVLHGHPR